MQSSFFQKFQFSWLIIWFYNFVFQRNSSFRQNVSNDYLIIWSSLLNHLLTFFLSSRSLLTTLLACAWMQRQVILRFIFLRLSSCLQKVYQQLCWHTLDCSVKLFSELSSGDFFLSLYCLVGLCYHTFIQSHNVFFTSSS